MSAQTVEINSVETVLRELAPLVEEVQRTLEQSLESDDPATVVDGVTSRLREIQGTLQLLDLAGPTLLVEEMRALSTALAQGRIEQQESGLEVLLKGVFKLPDYLDRIRSGRRDRPAVLLPLINELRSARGDQARSERDVFKPELEPVASGAAGLDEARDDGAVQSMAKRLRPRFHRALLGWYRGRNIEQSLDELGSVLQELAEATSSPATRRLWRVCGALTESLSDQGLEDDTNVKLLMARAERLLSQLVREGEGALERTIPLDLLRSLLYYVARSGSDSPRVREVKAAYQLDELLPGSGAEADFEGPNRGLLEVVGQGIRDDVASIRDAVEIYVHSEERRPDVLEGLPERLKQVADTFSMVGLDDNHELLRREADALAAIDTADVDAADRCMQSLADVLVRADSDLTALESGRSARASASDAGALAIRELPDSEYRPLLSAVVAAALDNLSKLREAIGAHCGDPEAGHEAVAEAPTLLAELEGAMAMLPLDSALPLARDLRRYIETELVERQTRPDDATQVLLADVVAGLEYYLEAVDHDRAAMTHLLESASRAITALQSGGDPITHSEDEQVVIESGGPEASDSPAAADPSEDKATSYDTAAPAGTSAGRGDGVDDLEIALEGDAGATALDEPERATASGEAGVEPIELDPLDGGELEVEQSGGSSDAGTSESSDGSPSRSAEEPANDGDSDPLDGPGGDIELADFELTDLEPEPEPAGDSESVATEDQAPTPEADESPSHWDETVAEVDSSADESGGPEPVDDADSGARDAGDEPTVEPGGSEPIDEPAAMPEPGDGAGTVAAEVDAEGPSAFPGDDEAEGMPVAPATGGGAPGGGAPEDGQQAPGVDSSASGSQYAIVGDEVDEEIVEVFLEEALGELDKINEYLPKWKANPGDEESLVVVRRAFHTLKGGGRLIGAELVGEFSWSMENMLNRVIDHSIDATPVLFDTLDEAATALPQLIEQIRGNRAPISGIDNLIERAHALSRGEEPPPGGGSGAAGPGDAPRGSSEARDTGDTDSGASTVHDEAAGAASGDDGSLTEAGASGGVDEFEDGSDVAAPAFDEPESAPPNAEGIDLAPPSDGGEPPAGEHGLGHDDASDDTATAPAAAPQQRADEASDEQAVDPAVIDGELIASFLAEGEDITQALDEAVERWRAHPDDALVVAEIQRHLHTLKGGARMAELGPLAELTHALENLVTAGQEGACELDEAFFATLRDGADGLSTMLGRVRSRDPLWPAEQLLERAQRICGDAASPSGEGPSQAASADDATASAHEFAVPPDPSADDPSERPALDAGDIELEPAAPVLEANDDAAADEAAASHGDAEARGSRGDAAPMASSVEPEVDSEPIDSFLDEADELVETCDEAVGRWRSDPEDVEPWGQLQRALHTLKGGARMADLPRLGVLGHELESLLHAVDQGVCDRNEALFDALQEAIDAFSSMLAQARAGQSLSPHEEVIDRIESLRHGTVPGVQASAAGTSEPPASVDLAANEAVPAVGESEPSESSSGSDEDESPSLVRVFATEAEAHQSVLRAAYLGPDGTPANTSQPVRTDVLRALHTLVGSAETAGCDDIAALAAPMEELLKLRRDTRADLSDEDVSVLSETVGLLDRMLAHVRGEAEEPIDADAIRQRLTAQRDKARAELDASYDEGGDELVDVFLEEADELLEACEQGVARWRERPDDTEVSSELQRSLHTLKGGARMAHIPPISDLTHEVEALVKAVEEGTCAVSEELFDMLQEAVDALTVLLEQVRGRRPAARVDWLVEDLQNLRERGSAAPAVPQMSDAIDSATDGAQRDPPGRVEAEDAGENSDNPEESRSERADHDRDDTAAVTASEGVAGDANTEGTGQAGATTSSQPAAEQIRVRSDLLDNLVNYAGEVSIYHSRLGEQMGQYRFNLNEFEQTVNRLREQLRQMEDETEAQILYSGEKEQGEQPKREDFDPLEFDRYTRIQELSRSLAESVGDLDSIKEILENLTRDAETLLTQQSRVSSELQDGLMQTRMVRFDGLRARLSRIVRQTASQVGKKAQMTMTGGELEVDRSIQERVVAPLEHVLRNAVSHGIEAPGERRQAGKPEQGTVSLDLHRGGTDVVLEISDDGKGIDPDAVREKAIKRGLIDAADDRDHNEVIKLILETGFSTADEITQISGRGVGMDVVDAEIRRLGGTLGINTVKGQGTRFTMRLPVTLAINQAVLVTAGDDTFAIPIASIEGVTQVPVADLKQYYIDPSKPLTYAEAEYRVQHLGSLLGTSEPKLDKTDATYPVIMVRAGDDRVALHVDAIQGRREVVVKPLGTPLNMLPGISGATIMADGSVVLILDIGGLLRTESRFVAAAAPTETEPAQPADAAPEESETAEGTPTVLVVDDSITMRKVSHRMLTRNGLEVATAKDGVEAMSWMAQRVPDIILLDIEMPRMDGYEVATNVRSDERLKNVPIIMATSRTGGKHRQRAEDIGVDQYLGKPYQEAELMDEINALIAHTEGA